MKQFNQLKRRNSRQVISSARQNLQIFRLSHQEPACQISETRKTETKSQSERDMEAAREKGRQILEDAGKAIAEEVKSLKAEVSGKKEAAIDFVITKLV